MFLRTVAPRLELQIPVVDIYVFLQNQSGTQDLASRQAPQNLTSLSLRAERSVTQKPTEGTIPAASSLFLHGAFLKSADPSTESFHTNPHLD